jgi:hypothetical protein
MDSATVKAIMGDRIVSFHVGLAHALDSVTAALLFSQCAYWSCGDTANGRDGWFWKTQVEMQEETGLTRYEQESARATLRKRGVLKEEKRGCPAKNWYCIDWDNLAKLIENSKLDSGKPATLVAENQQPCLGKNHDIHDTTHETTSQKIGANAPREPYSWERTPEDVDDDLPIPKEKPVGKKADILALAEHFTEVTHLRPVAYEGNPGKSVKERQVLWDHPLRAICDLAEWDIEFACNLVDDAVASMIEKRLSMSSPKSILKSCQNLCGSMRRVQAKQPTETLEEMNKRINERLWNGLPA